MLTAVTVEEGDITTLIVKDLGMALAPKTCPDPSDFQRG